MSINADKTVLLTNNANIEANLAIEVPGHPAPLRCDRTFRLYGAFFNIVTEAGKRVLRWTHHVNKLKPEIIKIFGRLNLMKQTHRYIFPHAQINMMKAFANGKIE